MIKQNNANDLDLTIPQSELKPLFEINSVRHASAIVYNWILIIVTMYLCGEYFNFHPVAYFFAVLIVGARMHGLAILMHDASHFRFMKNRFWNDLLTNIFTMYPIFTTIDKYRQNHMRHHRHLNSEHDPDWVAKLGKREFTFPKTKREFLFTVLTYLVLYQGIMDALWFLKRFGSSQKQPQSQSEKKWIRLTFFALLFTGITLGGLWKYYLLLWIVPYLSTFFMYQYIRSVAEHFGELAYDHLLTSTRTVKPNLVERFLIAPHNVGYHLEHHLYPGVPYYHLPELHQILMKDGEFADKAHITIGYVKGLLNELGRFEKTSSATA